MSKVVVVFGATDQLGVAVCKSLSRDFTVRAVTSDTCENKTEALKQEVPTISSVTRLNAGFDSGSHDEIDNVLDGAYGAFVMTNTDFSLSNCDQNEVQEGQNIADACQRAGLNHVVYCTQLAVLKILGMRARHMDAKNNVEAYMKKLGLPLSSLLLPTFYESLLVSPLRPVRKTETNYELEIPIGRSSIDMLSVDDVGEVVSNVMAERDEYLHKTVSITGGKYTVKDMIAIFKYHLHPNQFKDKQVTVEEFRLKKFDGAEDIATMFDFYCRVDQRFSEDLAKKLNPSVRSLESWVKENTTRLLQALDYPLPSPKDPWMV